jgi:hypothetical protein
MKSVNKVLSAIVIGASAVGFSAVSASAAIICTGNVCWHTHERYEYPPDASVTIHEDDWRGPNVIFREHEGRGYWRGERWETW